MAARAEFPRVFTELKKLFRPFAKRFKVIANTPAQYYLEGGYSEKYKKPMWFGGVRRGKAYVSFHLIAVYAFPGLLRGVSPRLRAACRESRASTSPRTTRHCFASWGG